MTEVGVKNCGRACWAKIPKSIVSTRCILRTIERTHGNSEGILEKVNAESERLIIRVFKFIGNLKHAPRAPRARARTTNSV